ncbi:hypothetical protein RIF29_40216 [Crotalaria pallida]|uniref:BHLH domain-containing protein n=1 Tax=Crotalaria pallida TaxID=3830 RepID=A0AAN9E3I4_CROPI
MDTKLNQLVLRSLCFNTHWNYAIFWKLKNGAPMVLTWEDAYHDGAGDGNALGLAVAKMSYHVYSLGEGIVGQVAATRKHRWIQVFEFADEWQSQISAGIKTIVVVPIVPLGVVQLGSLNKVTEDIAVVTNIRNLFCHSHSQIQSSLKNLSSDIMPASLYDTEKTMKSETLDVLMPLQCSGKNYAPHSAYEKMAGNVSNKHEGPQFYSDDSSMLLQSISDMMNLEHKDLEEMGPLNRRKCEGGSSGGNNMRLEPEENVSSFLSNYVPDYDIFNDLIRPSANVTVNSAFSPSVFLDAFVSENDKLHYADNNRQGLLKHTEKLNFQIEPCDKETSMLLKFLAGCELHEALGPAFLKGSKKYYDCATQVNPDVMTVDMPNETSCSQLTCESHPEHLLEAIVANICHSNNDVNSEFSFGTSMQSAVIFGKNPEASIQNVHTINSEGCSIGQSSLVREDIKQHCLSSSSGICDVMSTKKISPTCPSSYSGQFERSLKPAKNSKKKRARPGKNCRPRPRDRQLIQDRIKELRELVPNGAKCSIDSLLERAIKHILFLQGITKQADKVTKISDTKSQLHHMETDVLGSSSYEQGSSWAVEVGGHLKVHSILVENLSKDGQMLVEMLCEECIHFLEIAEAIRSLGLTILKGETKAHGEKIRICFVVEVQNSRYVHRLDILWSLIQIVQSKSTLYSQ